MTTILIKKKDTAGAPAPGDLTNAAGGTEIAVNTATKRIYTKDSTGTVVELGTNATAMTVTSLTDSGLTSGRVTYAGTAGLLQDSANLTFNGTTLTANTIGAYTLSGTIAGGGNQLNNIIIGTSTPLAGSFTTINASTSITNAGLTSGRVTFAGASGLLSDSANLTYGTGLSVNGISQVYQTGLYTTDGALSNYSVNNGVYLNGNTTGWSQLSGDGTRASYVRVWGSGASPANFIVLTTAGSERMRVDSSGNVGIGTSSPSASGTGGTSRVLEVNGAAGYGILNLSTTATASGSTTGLLQFCSELGSDDRIAIISAIKDDASTTTPKGYLYFGTANAGSVAERMRITSAGNVGIGTSSPNNNLEVYSTSNPSIALTSTSASLYSYFGMTSGTVGAQLYTFGQSYSAVYPAGSTALANDTYGLILNASNASGILRFQTNATERMRIDSSGDVLIGTTSSTTWNGGTTKRILAVENANSGSSNTIISLKTGSTTDGGGIIEGYATSVTSGSPALGSIAFARENTSNTALSSLTAFYTNTAGTVSEKMRLDSSGNLLVGTASVSAASEKVSIQSNSTPNLILRSTGNSSMRFYNSSDNAANSCQINYYGGTSFSLETIPAIPMVFLTTNAERMRIASNGDVLIGTSSSIGNGGVFQVKAPSAALYLEINTSNTTVNVFDIANVQNSAMGQMIRFWVNGYANTQVGSISTTTTTTAYNTTSDYRLKENIAPITGALAKVEQLKPVTYKWKSNGSDGQGFIAHELAEVVPDCVTGEKDAVDENGKPIHQGVDTSFLVATLTAAIQEQQALIKSLTTRLTALENK